MAKIIHNVPRVCFDRPNTTKDRDELLNNQIIERWIEVI